MRMRTSRYALGRLASLKRFCLLALVGLLSTSSPTIGGAGNTVGSNGTDVPAALVNRTPYLTNENSSDFSATIMSKRFAMMGENTGRNRANSFERGLYQFALTMNENGNFEIEGKRSVTINFEEQLMVLTGIIRPSDVNYDTSNTIRLVQ